MHINNAYSNARFFLFEFALVLIGCIASSLRPEFGWFFIIIAFFPLATRIIWKRSLFRSTYLFWLIPLFLITSFVGLLVAFDWDQANNKFLLIIGSILLFFSLTYQPKENLWFIAVFLGIFGVITTFIFILTNNWEFFTVDFKFMESLGDWLVKHGLQVDFDPNQNSQTIHANITAGIDAIFLPLNIVSTLHFWRLKKNTLFIINLLLCIILSIGVLITSSRAAWVASIFGLVILASLNILNIQNIISNNKFLILLIPTLVISIGVSAPFLLTNINKITPSISEITNFESRLQLARQTTYLIADFPFTGGGLGSFPGLYSQYILAIPYFMYGYSHNLYLDLTLEQGIFGFIIWVIIIMSCVGTLGSIFQKKYNNGDSTLLLSAIFAGLIILLVHGIIDDPIYSSTWGLPMLFLFPGLTIALSENDSSVLRKPTHNVFPILVIFVLITTAFFAFREQIYATLCANIGAIMMAKTELANWPTNEWSERISSPALDQAEYYFAKSLSHQEENFSANYRQGLIWMERHNFQQALPYLETALNIKSEHRGIQKNLGYCYAWLGKFSQAELVLEQIPEAQTEMEVYEWWWQIQGQNDLADKALQMAKILIE